jgi:hypothetical protein
LPRKRFAHDARPLFGRGDLAGVWAGDYRYASLLVSHLDAVLSASEAMWRRDVAVALALRRGMVTVQRHLTASMQPDVPWFQQNAEAQLPERTTIPVGGYSVIEGTHMLLRMDWRPGDRRWRVRVSPVDSTKAIFIGDDLKTASRS